MSWVGVEFKLGEAAFYLGEMRQDLTPAIARPGLQASVPYMSAPGTLVITPWQPRLYYHINAFLAATRSVPDIIQAWFGLDPQVNSRPSWRQWLPRLPAGEEDRRRRFQDSFRVLYEGFAQLPSSKARVVSVHRHGMPPVEVAVSGIFGIYQGGPAQALPSADVRPGPVGNSPAEYVPVISSPAIPLVPTLADFWLRDSSGATYALFPTCEGYLQAAGTAVAEARKIAAAIHGNRPLTPPPED